MGGGGLVAAGLLLYDEGRPSKKLGLLSVKLSIAIGGPSRFVLEYCSWYTANIVNISVLNALSFGSGLVTAVLLCLKRGAIFYRLHITGADLRGSP